MATKNEPDIIQNWQHSISLTEGQTLYQLLAVLEPENKRLDLDIEEIYEDRFLGSASGTELEKIGQFVGVRRKTGEGDDKLQKRIRGEFAAQASDTTYENFATVALSLLEADPKAVEIITPPESPKKVIELEVDGSLLDSNPLSTTELSSLLDRSVSAGARVDIIETGTFAFAGGDDALKGWDDGTWSSTVSN